MSKKNTIVIGAGFASLSAATALAQKGFHVTVLEKNEGPGGRARVFRAEGFTFDMGPSWYWMPDVFESYFAHFGKKVADYYTLERLDPSYTVVFGEDDSLDMPANMEQLCALFDSLEPGSGAQLTAFLKQAAYKYQVGINDLVYKPSRSLTEFMQPKLLTDMLRMDIFNSMAKHVRKYFSHEKLLKIVEFPVLFLGATPEETPALYSLMNYADLQLGTWYPQGGMHKIVEGMVALAEEQGVTFRYNEPVTGFRWEGNRIQAVETAQGQYHADVVVAGADYHYVETELLPQKMQSYSAKYWQTRTMAPSSLLFYLGIDKKIEGLHHHTLFFDEDFKQHAHEIYKQPQWPSKPLFYVCASSVSDPTVAPAGKENLFLLVPLAPDLDDTEAQREKYYHLIMERLERFVGQPLREHVMYKRSYAHRDFKADYHAFRGNAYGLANTLLQTAILKPSLKSKKVTNLYYTGQLTTPGPGVPPSLISGQVVAKEVSKAWK